MEDFICGHCICSRIICTGYRYKSFIIKTTRIGLEIEDEKIKIMYPHYSSPLDNLLSLVRFKNFKNYHPHALNSSKEYGPNSSLKENIESISCIQGKTMVAKFDEMQDMSSDKL